MEHNSIMCSLHS